MIPLPPFPSFPSTTYSLSFFFFLFLLFHHPPYCHSLSLARARAHPPFDLLERYRTPSPLSHFLSCPILSCPWLLSFSSSLSPAFRLVLSLFFFSLSEPPSFPSHARFPWDILPLFVVFGVVGWKQIKALPMAGNSSGFSLHPLFYSASSVRLFVASSG